MITAMLRFHIPLIKPDVRVSRIRLSDRRSRVRPRKVARPLRQPDEVERLVQVRIGEACGSPTLHLMLPSQPLAQPAGRVSIHGPVGFAHRAEAEVVGPPAEPVVDTPYLHLGVDEQPSALSQLADLATQSLDPSSAAAHAVCNAAVPFAKTTA